MTPELRKLILEHVEDDRAAREIITEIQLIESRVSDREAALEDQLLELRATR
jgi:hypothetical protein